MAHVMAWFFLSQPLALLAKKIRKILFFLVFLFFAFLLTKSDGDALWQLDLQLFTLLLSEEGAALGLAMVMRVVTIVLVSHLVCVGDPNAIAAGLRKLGVPSKVADSIDVVLFLVSDTSSKKGRGNGKGQGRGRGRGEGQSTKEKRRFWTTVKELAKGDVSIIGVSFAKQVDRVERHLESRDSKVSRDVAIVASVVLTMLTIKMLKLLPGLPFAPGHKGILLIPLYFAAGYLTRSRFGASWTGLTMGLVAFLLGDGRYGVFEIAKHVAPGIIVDLMVPWLSKNTTSKLVWCLAALFVAMGRFCTVVVIALLVQAPEIVYAFLLPGLLLHGSFGIAAGLLSRAVLVAIDSSLSEREATPLRHKEDKNGKRKKRTTH